MLNSLHVLFACPVSLTSCLLTNEDAIEFTLKADDGMAPWLLPEADVILLGVSRTGSKL